MLSALNRAGSGTEDKTTMKGHLLVDKARADTSAIEKARSGRKEKTNSEL